MIQYLGKGESHICTHEFMMEMTDIMLFRFRKLIFGVFGEGLYASDLSGEGVEQLYPQFNSLYMSVDVMRRM